MVSTTRVKLVAFDSMGVRSMATIIESSAGLIFIDPGAALAPWRYNLPPHEVELKTLREFLEEIYRYMREADYVVITHYHRDHYLYRSGEEEYYSGKTLFIKHPTNMINRSQYVRAYVLLKKMNVENKAKHVLYADNSSINIDGVKIEFSKPLPHGECNSKLGWVITANIIEDGEVVSFASDTQGCMCRECLDYIHRVSPDLLIISGPPVYLGLKDIPLNTVKLVESMKPGSTIIIDHHFLREKNYIEYMEKLRRIRSDVRVVTAAEYMHREIKQLEAYRDQLWRVQSKPRVLDEIEEE